MSCRGWYVGSRQANHQAKKGREKWRTNFYYSCLPAVYRGRDYLSCLSAGFSLPMGAIFLLPPSKTTFCEKPQISELSQSATSPRGGSLLPYTIAVESSSIAAGGYGGTHRAKLFAHEQLVRRGCEHETRKRAESDAERGRKRVRQEPPYGLYIPSSYSRAPRDTHSFTTTACVRSFQKCKRIPPTLTNSQKKRRDTLLVRV